MQRLPCTYLAHGLFTLMVCLRTCLVQTLDISLSNILILCVLASPSEKWTNSSISFSELLWRLEIFSCKEFKPMPGRWQMLSKWQVRCGNTATASHRRLCCQARPHHTVYFRLHAFDLGAFQLNCSLHHLTVLFRLSQLFLSSIIAYTHSKNSKTLNNTTNCMIIWSLSKIQPTT